MTCPIKTQENADLLLAYCARRLDAVSAAALERHIEICSECARFRDEQEMIWKALDAWEAAPVSPGFDSRLYARIEQANAAPWYERFAAWARPALWRPAFPLAAACTVIVAGFLLDQPHGTRVAPANTGTIQVTVSEAEQVERTLDDIQMLHQLEMASKDSEKNSKSL
jgi:hypothetical protein